MTSKRIFQSLALPNFRIFFSGQVVSTIGAWLQMTAMPWMVYRITGSALLLGVVAALSQIFMLVLTPFAGAIVDHYDTKRVLFITQILLMIQALLLAGLAATGHIQIWHIIVLAAFAGLCMAFDMPARQAFLVQIVPKENLMNAIGLNSMAFNSSRLIGPSIAGFLIAWQGEALCFLLNGLSYGALILALALITPRRTVHHDAAESIKKKFLAGITYVRGNRPLTSILIMLAISGLAGIVPMTLMPVFVKDIFHMDASGMGILMGAMGAGALVGTLSIAAGKNADTMLAKIFHSAIMLGTLMVLFAFIRSVWLAVPVVAVIGYFMMLQMGLSNTYAQTTTPDHLRGRVMGYFIMAFMGFAPLGSLLAGGLAHHLSAPATVAICGGGAALAALLVKRTYHA